MAYAYPSRLGITRNIPLVRFGGDKLPLVPDVTDRRRSDDVRRSQIDLGAAIIGSGVAMLGSGGVLVGSSGWEP